MQSVRLTSAALVAIVALSALTSVASAQSPPPGRRCVRVNDPEQLPPLPLLLDVQTFRGAAPKLPKEGVAFFSITFQTSGYPADPYLVQSTMPEAVNKELSSALLATLKDQPAGHSWTALFKIAEDKPLRVEIDRSIQCHAEQWGSLTEFDNWINQRVANGRRIKDWSLTAEVQLDTLGQTINARVLGPDPFPKISGIDGALARFVTFSAPTRDGRGLARTDTVTFGPGAVVRMSGRVP